MKVTVDPVFEPVDGYEFSPRSRVQVHIERATGITRETHLCLDAAGEPTGSCVTWYYHKQGRKCHETYAKALAEAQANGWKGDGQ